MMFYPEYMMKSVKQLQEKYALDEKEIIQNEKKWITESLTALYDKYDVLDIKFIANPYLRIYDKVIDGVTEYHLFMPKYFATQEMIIYWSKLKAVDLFMNSLSQYNAPISGNEIIEITFSNNPNVNINRLKERMNIVIRKFLSYQYLIINFNK